MHPEVRRILALPMVLPMEGEVVQQWQRFFCKESAILDPEFEGLRPMQAEALAAFYTMRGANVPLKVSAGKALIAWGCATIAHSYFGIEKVLLVVPAKSLAAFLGRHQILARRWLRAVPVAYDYQGIKHEQRMQLARRPGIHVVTEGLIQSKDAREFLAELAAQTYIIDEVHNFTRKSAARAKRLGAVISRIRKLGHQAHCAVLSASSGTAGIPRAWEFSYFALGQGSPLPLDAETAALFEGELDPSSNQGYTPAPGSGILDPIVNWAADNFEGFAREYTTTQRRLAYQLRQRFTPGMIIDPNKPVRKPTVIHNIDTGFYNQETQTVVDLIRSGITPSGDEMSSHLEQYRFMTQLTCGYYVELVWPTAQRVAVERGIPAEQAEDLLRQAKERRELENAYHKALRGTLERVFDDEMDTPFRIGQMFQTARNEGTRPPRFVNLYGLWREWKDFEEEHLNLPERVQIPRLLDDYRIRRALEWARQGPGFLWVYHDALFHWMREALQSAGLNPMVCDSGDKRAMQYINTRRDPSRVYLIRLGGYGEAIELDFLHRACYLEIVRNAKTMEQSLGRLDRTRQASPYLDITIFSGNSFDLAQMSAIIGTASKDAEVNGASHLLLEARYDPPYTELTSSRELSSMFEDYRAGDVDLQRVLQEINTRNQ